MLARREADTFLHTGRVAKRQKTDGGTITGCFPGCHQAQQQESQSLWDTELGNHPQLHPVFASRMEHLARDMRENPKCRVERGQGELDLMVQDLKALTLLAGTKSSLPPPG